MRDKQQQDTRYRSHKKNRLTKEKKEVKQRNETNKNTI